MLKSNLLVRSFVSLLILLTLVEDEEPLDSKSREGTFIFLLERVSCPESIDEDEEFLVTGGVSTVANVSNSSLNGGKYVDNDEPGTIIFLDFLLTSEWTIFVLILAALFLSTLEDDEFDSPMWRETIAFLLVAEIVWALGALCSSSCSTKNRTFDFSISWNGCTKSFLHMFLQERNNI